MALVVLGDQFGDTGKGKLVDYLCHHKNIQICIRNNGGANAGHTVTTNTDETHKLHLLPCGVLNPDCKLVIGAGTVIDPIRLHEEISKYDVTNRLYISTEAHLVHDIYKTQDIDNDAILGIGTTGQGIGTTYAAKMLRYGLRAGDLFDKTKFAKKYATMLKMTQQSTIDNVISSDEFFSICEFMIPFITTDLPFFLIDKLLTSSYQRDLVAVIETAHSQMLDINHGTYPYVTSSSCDIGGVLSGLGIPPQAIKSSIMVTKIYSTRVGNGPFITELKDTELVKHIQNVGHERGATTGRLRRVGWLDLPILVRGLRMNGCTEVALMKFDLLKEFSEIKFCDYYYNPNTGDIQYEYVNYEDDEYLPHYVSFPISSDTDISTFRKISHVTKYPFLSNILNFLQDYLRARCNSRIIYIGVGPRREQIIDFSI